MLSLTLARKIDPFHEAKKWIKSPGISMKIQSDHIQIEGNLDKDHIQSISELDIAKMSNVKPEKKDDPKEIKENGRVTRIKANFQGAEPQEFRRIRKAQVWEVDFGQPVGSELGYPHPAVVLKKSSTNNCKLVLPCSSKKKNGRVYELNFTKDTLKSADPEFLEKSENKTTYILFDQQATVDSVRFTKYLGTLDENVFQDILKELGQTDDEIKRRVTFEEISLTEKQRKILEITNRNSDILGVANNESFTYEQRVRGILSVFGFKPDMGGDIEYLVSLIKNTRTKNSSYIDLKAETEILTHGTILNAQTITGKMVELTKRRFRDVHPCLLEFVSLVNKLAS